MITSTQIAAYFGVLPPRINPGSQNIKILCPKCSHTRRKSKEKCLSVYVGDGEKEGVFECKHCDYKGKITDGEPVNRPASPPKQNLDIDESVLKYLTEERKITKEAIEILKVGSSVQWFGANKRCVNFNYFKDGRLYNTKFRSRDKDMRFQISGTDMILYNGDCIKAAVAKGELIITEGELDALSWISCGWHYAVSVPNGASENTSYLDAYMEDILDIDNVYICTDNDEKGKILEEALVKRIGEERCRLIRLPAKDANEVLISSESIEEAGAILNEAYENAEMPPVEGVYKLRDFKEELRRFRENGWPQTYPIEIDGFDHEKDYDEKGRVIIRKKGLLEIPLGQVIGLSGTPSSGKSEFADDIASRMMNLYAWPIAKISTEEDKVFNTAKMSGKLAQKHFFELNDQEAEIYENYLDKRLTYVEKDKITFQYVISKFEYCIRAYGVKMCILDNFSSLDLADIPGKGHEKIAWVLVRLQAFARKHNICLLLVVHPTKLQSLPDGGYKLPDGYDLFGSSAWFNFIDVGLSIGWTEEGVSDIKVWKVRYQQFVGRKGVIKIAFREDKGGIYMSMDQQDKQTYKEVFSDEPDFLPHHEGQEYFYD